MKRLVVAIALSFAVLFTLNADEFSELTEPSVKTVWNGFCLNEVTLNPGSPFYDAMMHHREYVLSLDPDRLLGHILKASGLEPKAAPYGGWEPGCTYGHYLSSLSLYYASTGDAVMLERLQYCISELGRCVEARPVEWIIRNVQAMEGVRDGNLSLRSIYSGQNHHPWDFNGAGNCWYSIHKGLAGLRDAVLYAGQKDALKVAVPVLDYISDLLISSNTDVVQAMLSVEHGGMVEVMTDFYAITGNADYLAAAEKFNHIDVIYPTAEGQDVLIHRHANDNIPKFVGAAKEYLYTAKDVYRRSAVNFWDIVTEHHTLANGGNGCYERFGAPDEESKRLDSTSSETCNTYNMLKLSHLLFMQTGGLKYQEYTEWALYNHILASIDMDHTGAVTYYCALRPGDYRTYSSPYDSFWCCVGTGLENHAKYGQDIYFNNGEDVLVSQYISSTLDWKGKGLRLEMSSSLPQSDTVHIKVVSKGDFKGRLMFRIPSWAKGASMRKASRKGDVFVVRKVSEGMELDLVLPRTLHVRWANDEPHYGSVCYGPLLLAADMGTERMGGDPRQEMPLLHFPVLKGNLNDMDSWILEEPSLRFRTMSTDGQTVSLLPYWQCSHIRYTAYFKIYTDASYDACRSSFTDRVIIGDIEDETAHGLSGTNHKMTPHAYFWANDRPMRFADGGEFSYRLRIDPSCKGAYTLICTWWGDEAPGHCFDVLVDGQRIADIDLCRHNYNTYQDEYFVLPQSLTEGKSSIEVKFCAHEGCTAGPLFDLRITSDTEYR